MLNPKPVFSFVIVNYRSADRVRAAAVSLPESWKREIIVVNNDPRESADLRRYALEAGFRVIDAGGNAGFGAAANIGAREAVGRFLFFLNPDAIWQWGTLSEIQELFECHPKVAIVGPRLIGDDGRVERWSAGLPVTLFRTIRNHILAGKAGRPWEFDRPLGVGWVSGAALCVRREAFESVGGFDESYFLYFEDVDLCDRIRKLGNNVALYPYVVVKHSRGSSFEDRHSQKSVFYRSQGAYFFKHRPRWEALTLGILRRFARGRIYPSETV